MHYHGYYLRGVITAEVCGRFGVHRFGCGRCGRTVSFLPDFCVPYKHYGARVIQRVLSLLLFAGCLTRAVSDPLMGKNDAGYSDWAAREWRVGFEANANNLRQFGIPRLGGGSQNAPDCAAVLRALYALATGQGQERKDVFAFCQVGLTLSWPPLGLFRAMLLPGCVT